MGYAPRGPSVGNILHVRTRATGAELLFRDDWDYDGMLWLLGREVERHAWRCLAYCFMPNHIHVVVRPLRETVSQGMRDLLSCYARRFNDRWGRRGHLVERRYRVTAARDEPHLYRIMRYVPRNPVEATLRDSPEHWPHSSYAATLGLSDPPWWLDVEGALTLFDRDARRARGAYRAYVEKRPS
jgi:REP element-mobilizing transposase RayT